MSQSTDDGSEIDSPSSKLDLVYIDRPVFTWYSVWQGKIVHDPLWSRDIQHSPGSISSYEHTSTGRESCRGPDWVGGIPTGSEYPRRGLLPRVADSDKNSEPIAIEQTHYSSADFAVFRNRLCCRFFVPDFQSFTLTPKIILHVGKWGCRPIPDVSSETRIASRKKEKNILRTRCNLQATVQRVICLVQSTERVTSVPKKQGFSRFATSLHRN